MQHDRRHPASTFAKYLSHVCNGYQAPAGNFAKHGLDFADAELVFAGACVTFVDDRFDYEEERFVTLGLVAGRIPLPPSSAFI